MLAGETCVNVLAFSLLALNKYFTQNTPLRNVHLNKHNRLKTVKKHKDITS